VAVTSGYFSHAGRKARHCHLTCFDVEEESQFRMVPVTAVLGLSGRGQWRPYGGIGGGAAYVYDRPWYYERAAAEWVSAAFIVAGLERRRERFGAGLEISWLGFSTAQGLIGSCCAQRDLGGLSATLALSWSTGAAQ